MSEYRKELLEDCFSFMKLIGEANRLTELGWKSCEIRNDNYSETIEEYFHKYCPDEAKNTILDTEDNWLYAEDKLYEFFEEEMTEILKI